MRQNKDEMMKDFEYPIVKNLNPVEALKLLEPFCAFF